MHSVQKFQPCVYPCMYTCSTNFNSVIYAHTPCCCGPGGAVLAQQYLLSQLFLQAQEGAVERERGQHQWESGRPLEVKGYKQYWWGLLFKAMMSCLHHFLPWSRAESRWQSPARPAGPLARGSTGEGGVVPPAACSVHRQSLNGGKCEGHTGWPGAGRQWH